MKTCFLCHAEKPLSEFYPHKRMKDGYLNKCKACAKQQEKDRRQSPESRAAVLERDRQRSDQPHRVAARKAYAASDRGKNKDRIASKAWAERNRIKREAHIAVGNAIRDGRLTKHPCEVCGSPYVQAHHDDYAKPLDVRWLCRPCHTAHHKAEREAQRRSL